MNVHSTHAVIRCFAAWIAAALLLCGSNLRAEESFTLDAAPVMGPLDPIQVDLLITTAHAEILAFGARITYNPVEVALVEVKKGVDVPDSWTALYTKTSTLGQVDVVFTNPLSPVVMDGSLPARKALRITFQRIGVNCQTAAYGFFTGTIVPEIEVVFPANQYLFYPELSEVKLQEPETLAALAGPVFNDHSFIRGNVNNLGDSRLHLDLQDVIDLLGIMFPIEPPVIPFPCRATLDANDDGTVNIADLITLVHGIFNPTLITIDPPNALNPGLGKPGVGSHDRAGAIPSMLGCATGQTCD